jgi:hypothetical protein
VVGQANFTSSTSGSGMANLNSPRNVAIDLSNNKMYVNDRNNYRVLRYSYPVTSNNPTAEIIFGNGYSNPGTQSKFNSVYGIAVYNGALWVSDGEDNRILKFDNAYSVSSNFPNASVVLGQTGFTTQIWGRAANQLSTPSGICIDASGNMWVADGENNRVLKYSNVNSKATNANADLVLGQSGFDAAGNGSTLSTMNYPSDVYVAGTGSSTIVWVADAGNNRVLRFNNPTSNGVAASGVLSGVDVDPPTQSSFFFNNNYGWITGDNAGRLYVADYVYDRILTYSNAASKSDGANADNVLGVGNFTTYSTNACSQSTFNPYGITVDNANNLLIVSDQGYNRVMIFSASSALPVELTSFTASTHNSEVNLAWNTATEVNNYGFEIERRAISTSTWQKIAFVAGNGTSNALHSYSYVDQPVVGTYAYRLKQIDNGGAFKYSQETEVTIDAPKVFALCQNYPNPFNPTTTISFDLPSKSFASLKVYDIIGREVATVVSEEMSAGSYTRQWIATNMSSGVYFYRLQTGTFTETN